jgi:hypothetical protein
MLDKLLKHNSLGSKEEILYILFNAISSTNEQSLADLKSFCISHKYNISKSFDGIISLLNYIGFIDLQEDTIKLNTKIFDHRNFQKEDDYFINQHFYFYLFSTLSYEKQLHRLFTVDNVQFDSNKNAYFIKNNLIPFKSFSLKNLLLSLNFLSLDVNNHNHLILNESHIQTFEKIIITEIKKTKKTKRKLSLKRLKEIQKAQEEAGMKAELFVLKFEKDRLKNHPFKKMIKIISSDFSNAGYDIESFTGFNSIVPNRFIEVKSYTDDIAFYWSKNEANVAEELGDDYFLYLVDRSKYHLKEYKPMIIKNPFNRVFKNDIWKIETENWKISFEK